MKRKYILISIILISLIIITVGIGKIYSRKRKIVKFQYNGYEFEYDKTKWPKYINYDPDKGGEFITRRGLRFYNKEHYYVHLQFEYWKDNKNRDNVLNMKELTEGAYLIIHRLIFDRGVEIVCKRYDCRIYEEVGEDRYKHFKAEILGYKDSDIFISSPEDLTQNDFDYVILPFFNQIYKAKKVNG